MSLSMEADYTRDLRSDAVPVLRKKNKKSRYQGVSPALLGQPSEDAREKKARVNEERKSVKSTGLLFGARNPREKLSHDLAKQRKAGAIVTNEDLVVLPLNGFRGKRHMDDDTVPGVLYSYDSSSTPSFSADAWGTLVTQAEAKYENKVFENLVKTEYELIESTSEEDSDEEFELI